MLLETSALQQTNSTAHAQVGHTAEASRLATITAAELALGLQVDGESNPMVRSAGAALLLAQLTSSYCVDSPYC
eukprot:SAG22_NODE_3890_length_1481_cov_1.711288_1_plen_74_part_00